MTEAELEAAFEAMMRESEEAEALRAKEDVGVRGAGGLVFRRS